MADTIHICRSPRVDRTYRVPDDPPIRYCYGCRKHLPHTWHFGVYDEPTYWEPPTILRCDRCGLDRTTFPGTGYDGPRPIPRKVLDWFQACARIREARHQTTEGEGA